MKNIISKVAVSVLVAYSLVGTTDAAPVQARVRLKNGSQLAGTMIWKPATKVYEMSAKGSSGAISTREIKPEEIDRKQVQAPGNWNDIMKLVNSNPNAALGQLDNIIKEYAMLEFDERAAEISAKIYMRQGKPDLAVRVCDRVVQYNKPAAAISSMAPIYWQALIAIGRTTNLENMLNSAIKSGDRGPAAQAYIARGDLAKKDGRPKDALKDGYLRVVYLFRDVREAQPEALDKALKTFEELNQMANADKMRKVLLSKYRDSVQARKLSGN